MPDIPERTQLQEKGQPMPDIPEKTIQMLIDKAKEVSEHAYCPYSRFKVGAAVLTLDDKVFSGCNVENASYGLKRFAPSGMPCFRWSLGQTGRSGRVVYTPTKTPTAPCGACRQVINEFGPGAGF